MSGPSLAHEPREPRRGRRWKAVVIALLAVAALALLVMRSLHQRSAAQAAAAPRAVEALELTSRDLVEARTATLVRSQAVSGSLRAVHSAVVRARVAGELRDLVVREGDAVTAGQVVARIDPTEYEARLRQAEQLASASKAQLEIARQTYRNNQALVEQGFISKNALDTSSFTAQSASANLASAEAAADVARKALRDTVLRAPLAGQVSVRAAQPGERMAVDAKVLEIVDISQLELEAALAPQDVVMLEPGRAAQLDVEGYPQPVDAKVARINPSTQQGTRAILVYLQVDNPGGLRQGLFARGRIELERKTALVLPAGAVRIDQSAPYAVVFADGQAQQRQLVLGARGLADFGQGPEDAVEVLSGLQASERVLRASAGLVRPGTPLKLGPPPTPVGEGAASRPVVSHGDASAARGAAAMCTGALPPASRLS